MPEMPEMSVPDASVLPDVRIGEGRHMVMVGKCFTGLGSGAVRKAAVAGVVAASLAFTGCNPLGGDEKPTEPVPQESSTPEPTVEPTREEAVALAEKAGMECEEVGDPESLLDMCTGEALYSMGGPATWAVIHSVDEDVDAFHVRMINALDLADPRGAEKLEATHQEAQGLAESLGDLIIDVEAGPAMGDLEGWVDTEWGQYGNDLADPSHLTGADIEGAGWTPDSPGADDAWFARRADHDPTTTGSFGRLTQGDLQTVAEAMGGNITMCPEGSECTVSEGEPVLAHRPRRSDYDMGNDEQEWSAALDMRYFGGASQGAESGHKEEMDTFAKGLSALLQDPEQEARVVEVAAELHASRFSDDMRPAAGMVLQASLGGVTAVPAEALFHPFARPSAETSEVMTPLAEAAGDDEAWAEALAELDAQPSGETPEEFIFLGWTDVSPQTPDDFGFAWSDGSTPHTGRYSDGTLQLDQ